MVGTVGANVGYILGGEYRWWDSPSSVPEVEQVIFSALERLRPFASLSTLSGAWDIKGADADPGKAYRLVVVWLLLGDIGKVRDHLRLARIEYCKQDDEVCEQFRHFEARVEERIRDR